MGTIRLRLTLWYALLFLVAGVVLLVVVYGLVQRAFPEADPGFVDRVTERPTARTARQTLTEAGMFPRPAFEGRPQPGDRVAAVLALIEEGRSEARDEAMRALVVQSSLALLLMAVLSVGAGWWIAGRMLRPVAGITETVRQINDARLADHRVALQGPRDELRELADQFDAMLDRLDTAFRAQRDFVANASHELRTPLAVMRTELDVTFDDPAASPEERRAGVEVLRRGIVRAEALIGALLTLERADAPRVRAERVDLAAQVSDVIDQHAGHIEERGISVHTDLEPVALTGDPVLIERMIENLLANAIAHNDAGTSTPWIEVSTRRAGDDAVLRVANSAREIDPSTVDALFERFHRLDASRSRETGGHGLGLAIVRAVARHHGGDARAEVIPGGFACEVRLPADALSP